MEVTVIVLLAIFSNLWGAAGGLVKYYNKAGEEENAKATLAAGVFFALLTIGMTIVAINIVT